MVKTLSCVAIGIAAFSASVGICHAQATDKFQRTSAMGPTLPAQCTVGQTWFLTGVPPGQNWYGCTSSDHWTQQVGQSFPAGSQSQYLQIEPNTGNATTYRFNNLPSYAATDYNFPPQQPGGSLIVGVNVATMTPCPQGVAGSDVAHYYYLSGGSGTAEAVLGTGGTCTSGASSGTVIFTAANTHSGAWTIASATLGMQEAVYASGGSNARIVLPPGTGNVYAPTSTQGSYLSLDGQGATVLNIVGAATNGFSLSAGSYVQISDVAFTSSTSTSGFAVYTSGLSYARMTNIFTNGVASGIEMINCFMCGVYSPVMFNLHPSTGFGIHVNGSNDQWIYDPLIIGSFSDPCGVSCEPAAGISVPQSGGLFLTGGDVLQSGTGLMVSPGNGQVVQFLRASNVSYDQNSSAGVRLQPSGSGVIQGTEFNGVWSSTCGVCIQVNPGGTVDGLSITDPRVLNSIGNGIEINAGTNIAIRGGQISGNNALHGGNCNTTGSTMTLTTDIGNGLNVTMAGNPVTINSVVYTIATIVSGTSLSTTIPINGGVPLSSVVWSFGTAGQGAGIEIAAGVSKVSVSGVQSGALDLQSNSQGFGIFVAAGSGDNLNITNNMLLGNSTSPLAFLATGTHQIINNNTGVDDRAFAGLASASSITLTTSPPVYSTYLTGTTGTTMINGGWTGRLINLVKADSGSVTIGGGGNVPKATTITQGQSLILNFDGTDWYPSGAGTGGGGGSVNAITVSHAFTGTQSLTFTHGLNAVDGSSNPIVPANSCTDVTSGAQVFPSSIVPTSANVATITYTGLPSTLSCHFVY